MNLETKNLVDTQQSSFTKRDELFSSLLYGGNIEYDIQAYRAEIMKYIQDKKGGYASQAPFYNILRNKVRANDPTMQNLGFTKEDKNSRKRAFASDQYNYNPGGWSGKTFNESMKIAAKERAGGTTYNYYVGLAKTKENILLFKQSLPLLEQKLTKLTRDENVAVSYKTQRLLDAICVENDNLKIFYYDKKLKHKIDKLMQEWLIESGVLILERPYTHGVDKPIGKEKPTFGQIVANQIDVEFSKVIQNNGDKYSNEQYFERLDTYFDRLVKGVRTSH